MYMSLGIALAFAASTIHACNPGTDGCDHPGNFTGARMYSPQMTIDPENPTKFQTNPHSDRIHQPSRRILQPRHPDYRLRQRAHLILRPTRVRIFTSINSTYPPHPSHHSFSIP